MKDLRVRTQRLPEGVERKFDKLLEKYPEYSKTPLINLAYWRLLKGTYSK